MATKRLEFFSEQLPDMAPTEARNQDLEVENERLKGKVARFEAEEEERTKAMTQKSIEASAAAQWRVSVVAAYVVIAFSVGLWCTKYL